jgi:hypothetical protein
MRFSWFLRKKGRRAAMSPGGRRVNPGHERQAGNASRHRSLAFRKEFDCDVEASPARSSPE